jgi:hypothetical protein
MDCLVMGVNRLCGRSAVRAVGQPLKLYGRWHAASFVLIDLAPIIGGRLENSASSLPLSLLAQAGLGSPQRLPDVGLAVAVESAGHCRRVLGWVNRFQLQGDLVNAKGG